MNHKEFKITGDFYEITPPPGEELPYCPKCFLRPTTIRMVTCDLATRMRAKVAGSTAPSYLLIRLPCDHAEVVKKGESLEDAMTGLIGRKLS